MKTWNRRFLAIVAVAALMLLGTCSSSTLSYSAICAQCLQHAAGVEKSVFGVRYYREEVHRQASGGLASPDIFGPPIARLNPHLYEEISGHPCAHRFIRTGFCDYTFGMVGCGTFGGPRYDLRFVLIENVYRAYGRVPEKPLARDSFDLVDQLFPIGEGKNAFQPPLRHPLEAEALPNEPLSILLRGLALVSTAAEWRLVLEAARNGDGSLDLLNNQDSLAARLEHPDLAVRLQAINQLAAMKTPEAWAKLAKALSDLQTRKHAAERIVWGRYFPLFDAVLEAYEKVPTSEVDLLDPVRNVPDPFGSILEHLKPEEVRTLLAQQRPRVDRVSLAAIREQNRFEFFDEVLAVLKQRPSASAIATVESLIEGPYPLDVTKTSGGGSAKDPWTVIAAETDMRPVEHMTGYSKGAKRMLVIEQQVVIFGKPRDPANWSKLRDLYLQWVEQCGAEWWSAGFAQAMAESDRAKTLAFLAGELNLDEARWNRTLAALGGLAVIADSASVPALEAFREKFTASPFEQNARSRKFLDFALHRCRGIHRWRLVTEGNGAYSIQKPESPAKN